MKEPLLYKIVKPIITILVKIFWHPTVEGKENILDKEKIILAGNHTSYFDPILLIAISKRPIHFLAKDSLNKGIKKILFKNMGIIPVNRKIKNPWVIKEAVNRLNHNQVIGIFPEGTISRTNKTLPFKMGAVKMAKDADAYIVPFVIKGSYNIFKRNLSITFLEPYKIKDKDLAKENEKLQAKVVKLLERK